MPKPRTSQEQQWNGRDAKKTHKSPQERKPDLEDRHNTKFARGGEDDAECACKLIGVVCKGVEVISKAYSGVSRWGQGVIARRTHQLTR